MKNVARGALVVVLAMSTLTLGAQTPGLVFEEVTAQTGVRALVAAWRAERAALGDTTWWPTAIVAGDFSGTGRPDLVFSQHTAAGTRVFANVSTGPGIPFFEDQTKARTLAGSFADMAGDGSPYVWDVNGDGVPDLGALSDESTTWAAINDGTGRFTLRTMPFRFPQARLGDIDGDGQIDLIGLVPLTPLLNRNGVYTPTVPPAPFLTISAEMRVPRMATAEHQRTLLLGWYTARRADLGTGEVILATFGSAYAVQAIFALARNAAGVYEDVTAAIGLPLVGHIGAVLDVDRDGKTDVLVAGSAQSGIYRGDGAGHLVRQVDALATDLSVTSSTTRMTTLDSMADFDEDGQPELLIVNFRYGSQSRLYRKSGEAWVRAKDLIGAWQFVVTDLDGDGRLDLVAGTNTGPRLFLNRTPALGTFLNLRLGGAVDTVVEAYQAGGLGDPSRLITRVRNNTDGIPAHVSVCAIGHSYGGNLPLHLGLGAADTVDLRVTAPTGTVTDLKGVKTNQTVPVPVPPPPCRF